MKLTQVILTTCEALIICCAYDQPSEVAYCRDCGRTDYNRATILHQEGCSVAAAIAAIAQAKGE